MESKGTIHVIADYFLPVRNGMEINMFNTYSYFVRKGWSITIHTTSSTHDEKDILPKNEVINGIKVIRYPSRLFKFKILTLSIYNEGEIICLHDFGIENM